MMPAVNCVAVILYLGQLLLVALLSRPALPVVLSITLHKVLCLECHKDFHDISLSTLH
jgi:hypothetical protein